MTLLVEPLALKGMGASDFRLEILTPLGQPYPMRRIFDATTPERTGVVDTVDATVAPGAISKSFKFSGRKDYIAAHKGEVVVLTVNDGDGVWRAAGCGILTTGHSPDDLLLGGNYGDLVRSYEASTQPMLERSVIRDNRYYPPQDIGAIVRQIVATFRHPSILYDDSLIPNVGVRLDEGFRLPAADFVTAIGELAKKVQEANGLTISWGVRADRKFYFNFPEGVEEIAFDADAQNYRELAVDLSGLCTAVVWEVGNTPNVRNYVGAYKPTDLVYTSVIDAEAHAELQAYKGLQATGNLFVKKAAAGASFGNFDNPEHGWNSDENGERVLGTVASMKSGVTSATFTIDPGAARSDGTYARNGLPLHGFSLRYRMNPGDSTSLQSAYVWVLMLGDFEDGSGQQSAYINFPLPYTLDESGSTVFTDFDAKLPPGDRWLHDASGKWVKFRSFFTVGVTVSRTNAAGSGIFSISDFRFMCLNTPLLDASAQAEKKLPAQNPAQLRRVTYVEGLPFNRFVQPTPFVKHTERPDGSKVLPVSEVRYSFSQARRFECVVDVGNPSRENDTDRLLERISQGVDKRDQRLEILRPSALL